MLILPYWPFAGTFHKLEKCIDPHIRIDRDIPKISVAFGSRYEAYAAATLLQNSPLFVIQVKL